jgi:hypothetical protein
MLVWLVVNHLRTRNRIIASSPDWFRIRETSLTAWSSSEKHQTNSRVRPPDPAGLNDRFRRKAFIGSSAMAPLGRSVDAPAAHECLACAMLRARVRSSLDSLLEGADSNHRSPVAKRMIPLW